MPRYPVGIISKSRYDTMLTSRTLSTMKVPHYIVIEPQEEHLYEQALDKFKIRPWVTLIIAPFSNHGNGSGRARNYWWDCAIAMGSERHWILDDNIYHFMRLQNNRKIIVNSGVIFDAAEDFIDRYENVPLAGLQYSFFIAAGFRYPPFLANTRCYSCLLIDNKCKHKWRGKYNEDVILSLDILKDGDCTIQFNAFLQDKAATQTIKGGNTQELYHAEGNQNREQWRDGKLNPTGTINKSKMLIDIHPDVSTMIWKYGRWHHWVDYRPFEHNQLKLKPGLVFNNQPNNYGMKLITNYDPKEDL